jgi:hypothetical protein
MHSDALLLSLLIIAPRILGMLQTNNHVYIQFVGRPATLQSEIHVFR